MERRNFLKMVGLGVPVVAVTAAWPPVVPIIEKRVPKKAPLKKQSPFAQALDAEMSALKNNLPEQLERQLWGSHSTMSMTSSYWKG